MRASWVLTCLLLVAACAIPAAADSSLTCSSFGATCANPLQITAQFTGDITGNLYYQSANFTDYVRVIDTNPNNSWTSPWVLSNQGGINSQLVTFGQALRGDVLVLQLCDQQEQPNICTSPSQNQYLFASDPNYSADGKSHALVNEAGGVSATANDPTRNRPKSWMIWMEDLSTKEGSDWDYNDTVIALHNVNISFDGSDYSSGLGPQSEVPEPGTISLLASSLVGGLLYKFRKN